MPRRKNKKGLVEAEPFEPVGWSGVVRIVVSQFLEKGKSEKENKNEKSEK